MSSVPKPHAHRAPPTDQDMAQLRQDMREDAEYLADLQSQYGHPFLDTNAWWSTEDTDAA